MLQPLAISSSTDAHRHDASPRCHRRHRRSRMSADGVVYKIASCRKEREDAFRLIHDVYVDNGLMKANAAGLRVTPFHLLPTTNLFVAYHHDQLIYTMTLIGDDSLGLPLERVYQREVDARRRETGDYFAEVSCLASRPGHFPRSKMFEVFVHLAGMMVQSAHENGVRRLLIACHPRHARFYQSFLGFEQVGSQRSYSELCDSPAVACEHDFARAEIDPYKLYDRVHAPVFHRWELYHQPMLKEDRDYFAEITEFYNDYFPLESFS